MEKFITSIYIDELEKQCEFFQIGFNRINNISDISVFWYDIQNILVSAANISKLLWPNNNKKKSDVIRAITAERGSSLRKIFDINEDSILKSKRVRNAFEHYDEKLDEWQIESKNHIYIDSNIGNKNSIKIDTDQPTAYMRNFDPESKVLTFRDEEYDTLKIATEIFRLHKKIQEIKSYRT